MQYYGSFRSCLRRVYYCTDRILGSDHIGSDRVSIVIETALFTQNFCLHHQTSTTSFSKITRLMKILDYSSIVIHLRLCPYPSGKSLHPAGHDSLLHGQTTYKQEVSHQCRTQHVWRCWYNDIASYSLRDSYDNICSIPYIILINAQRDVLT